MRNDSDTYNMQYIKGLGQPSVMVSQPSIEVDTHKYSLGTRKHTHTLTYARANIACRDSKKEKFKRRTSKSEMLEGAYSQYT